MGKSALKPKLYCALIMLSVGLGWAGKNFGTQCPNNVFVYKPLKIRKEQHLEGQFWDVGLGVNLGKCLNFLQLERVHWSITCTVH